MNLKRVPVLKRMFCPGTTVGATGATGAIDRCFVQAKQAAWSVNFQPALVMPCVSVDCRAAEDIYRLCSLQAHNTRPGHTALTAPEVAATRVAARMVEPAAAVFTAREVTAGRRARAEATRRAPKRKAIVYRVERRKKPTPFFFQIYSKQKDNLTENRRARESK